MTITINAVDGVPEIQPGDDLAELIAARHTIEDGDIVVIAQKVVSKSENRFADPASVVPGHEAVELAAITGKEPAMVQLILDESSALLRAREGVLIVETRQGFVCANAGIDSSNVPGEGRVLLLPEDADASARAIRARLGELTGARVGVLVTDSFGRAWRTGQVDTTIGCAGIEPQIDFRGHVDRDGRELTASIAAVADEVAAAADLARTKVSGTPIVVVGGRQDLLVEGDGPGVRALLREHSADLFR